VNPSQEITALRKNGQLDEAYGKAKSLFVEAPSDRYIIGALGWCLIDLVKRYSSDGNSAELKRYSDELLALEVPSSDELLTTHRQRVIDSLTSEGRATQEAIREAKRLAWEKQHEDAIRIYAELADQGRLDGDLKVSYGWELWHANRAGLKTDAVGKFDERQVGRIRRHLKAYLDLGISDSAKLHSGILQQAHKLSGDGHLKIVPFARIWNLQNLQGPDFESFKTPEGKELPSLAEKVITLAAKEAALNGNRADMQFIRPYLESAIDRFPENIFLKYRMVKLLKRLGESAEALRWAVDFARKKANEFWTWDILGDLQNDNEMRLSCYAKALTCSNDDGFTGKVRIKFAKLLAERFPGEAKAEIERVIEFKRREGSRISVDIEQIISTDWFRNADAKPATKQLYDGMASPAEEILFSHLPWVDACLGEEFEIDGKDGTKTRCRRKLIVAGPIIPFETHVPASHPEVRAKAPGFPVAIQMEAPVGEPWKVSIHRIKERAGSSFDVFTDVVGVIYHVNHERGVLHFVVSKDIQATWPLSKFPERAELGRAVAVKISHFFSKGEKRCNPISVVASDALPKSDVLKRFSERIEVSNGMGFTPTGIFIPPDIVAMQRLVDGDWVVGEAVINFNKRRGVWGWKAISGKKYNEDDGDRDFNLRTRE
jgi:hypothetical protein